jgi:predicted Zn-dependent protease
VMGEVEALARPGLAQMWLGQGLYAPAVRELRALLEADPSRYDLQALLAEALWRAGSEKAAAELGEMILVEHPHCLMALLIAGAFWLHSARDAAARRWLLAAQALDPENAVAQELFGARSPLPPRAVRLPWRESDLPPLDLPYGDDEDDLPAEDYAPDIGDF